MAYVILVGMMGSGKSTVGRLLADELGREFVDADWALQHRLGLTIPRLFKLFGEEGFRQHETAFLRKLEAGDGVLSTGGGVVMREENWVEMRRLGQTVFLDVDPHTIMQRLTSSRRKRPLLETDNWESTFMDIWTARREHYLKADFHVVAGDDEFEAVSHRIREVVGL
ncbi:MAG: shikimate kinase [Fimbriimonadaceae bacterium]|nr:shikimate kinase [Fimbriimonadaceae bacterium]